MAPAKVAMGLAAAIPALVLGATMLAAAWKAEAPRQSLRAHVFALAVLGGAAVALAGILGARRGWVAAGAVSMAVGSVPLLRSGLAVLVLLSAGLLVALARPAADARRLRTVARLVTALCLALLALLAWRDRATGDAPGPLDALLWLALLALAAYAWWPARRREGLGASR